MGQAYLTAIDRGTLPAGEVALDQLGRFPTLRDPRLAELVRKHWGVTREPLARKSSRKFGG